MTKITIKCTASSAGKEKQCLFQRRHWITFHNVTLTGRGLFKQQSDGMYHYTCQRTDSTWVYTEMTVEVQDSGFTTENHIVFGGTLLNCSF